MDQVLQKLRDAISSVYMGNDRAVDRLLTCLLARGHALVEDVPGVGKTVLANALARSIDARFARIQCTPDLLPTDITGAAILDRRDGDFSFRPGPVFANIVLTAQAQPFGDRAGLQRLEQGLLICTWLTLWAGTIFNSHPRCEDADGGPGATLGWCDGLSVMIGVADAAAGVAALLYFLHLKGLCRCCLA